MNTLLEMFYSLNQATLICLGDHLLEQKPMDSHSLKKDGKLSVSYVNERQWRSGCTFLLPSGAPVEVAQSGQGHGQPWLCRGQVSAQQSRLEVQHDASSHGAALAHTQWRHEEPMPRKQTERGVRLRRWPRRE